MSAFMVSKAHIATLAVYATEARYSVKFGSLLTVARMLARENAASVNYRYPSADLGEPFMFRSESDVRANARADLLKNPVAMIKAAQCLEYQSCEHPAWEKSDARRVVRNVISNAIGELPGYSEAPWGIP